MSNQNPFVVSELHPERRDGSRRGVYQLNATSAHPVRHIGRDEDGMPIEDTLPTVAWRYFVTSSGCINKVPIRTCSVSSNDVDGMHYEQMIESEKVERGWIPLALCPYSTQFQHITKGPFVKPPAGEEDCGGDEKNGGCVHMKALMVRRKEKVLKKHTAEVRRIEAMKDDQIERMRDGIVEGVGKAMANALDVASAAKSRLRTGKGEVDAG